MVYSAAFEPVRKSSDHVPVAPGANELSAVRPRASRSRPAGGLLRPSQVPAPGTAAWQAGSPSSAGPRAHDGLKDPGQPLAAPVKQEMEARLGADFTQVRVHTGSAARASTAALNAHAYTLGSDVVIGDGGADRHVLAHELTHVIQQSQGPVAGTLRGNGLRVSDPSDHDEQAAEANAARVMRADPPARQAAKSGTGSALGAPVVQRMLRRRNVGEKEEKEAEKKEETKQKNFPEGTSFFHGTRWASGNPRWWESGSPFPNKEGEDGGISFTSDPDASPKTKNANVLLEYKLLWELDATYCASKGDFYSLVQKGNVCCTDAEKEIVFPASSVADWLEFARVVHERVAK